MTVNCEFVLHSDCMHKTIRETTKIKNPVVYMYLYCLSAEEEKR